MALSKKLTPTQAPIAFLVAKDRSGTTLLQTMLDSHPNICAPLESRFVLHLMSKYKNEVCWDEKLKIQFQEDLFKEQKIELFWELDKEALNERISALPESTTYGEICKQVYVSSKSFHNKETIKLIVDKNPIYAIMIPMLQEVYPNAKFIHLVRDYRGNVSSIRSLNKKVGVKKLGMSWVMTNMEIEKSKDENPNNFITIRYEDLLDSPKEELERLIDFFDLEFHPDMLTYHMRIEKAISTYLDGAPNEKIRKIREIGIAKVHKNLSKPLNTTFKNKWERTLSSKEISTLETYSGGLAEKYGYYFTTGIFTKNQVIPISLRCEMAKLRLYYKLPIWLRELKSKPSMPFIDS
ncbi:sulfotransferase [Aequorivita sp. H23M31]|uniref:Sulfotransferase n=1 Tax=Aequorivita ciconiae TaxID=2494375 RepID=A0A410G4I5_9FLAO|nr:sulfotransferase [Aequorivita sp. H23M31]QAA82135.1 sulfotransferase [Aequorivita sp. H23M31]